MIAAVGAFAAKHGLRKLDENTRVTKQTQVSTKAIEKSTNGLLAQRVADATTIGEAKGAADQRDKDQASG